MTHLGEPLEATPLLPARGLPVDCEELVRLHDDGASAIGVGHSWSRLTVEDSLGVAILPAPRPAGGHSA